MNTNNSLISLVFIVLKKTSFKVNKSKSYIWHTKKKVTKNLATFYENVTNFAYYGVYGLNLQKNSLELKYEALFATRRQRITFSSFCCFLFFETVTNRNANTIFFEIINASISAKTYLPSG